MVFAVTYVVRNESGWMIYVIVVRRAQACYRSTHQSSVTHEETELQTLVWPMSTLVLDLRCVSGHCIYVGVGTIITGRWLV